MTAEQPIPVDAMRIHGKVFNALTRALAAGKWGFVPLSVRELVATEIELEVELDIRADERARIAAVIDPALLDSMAGWFDDDDRLKQWLYEQRPDLFPEVWKEPSNEMQQDLRRWARLLRGEPEDGTDAH